MHDQEQEIEKLKSQVAELQAKLDGYEIKVSESGNLAEAAAKVSGLFEAAQLTVDTYLENMKKRDEQAEAAFSDVQKQAEQIFEEKELCTDIIYLVSDNTGNSNGGSDDMMNECGKGQIIWNTKEKGTINVTNENIQRVLRGTVGAWGV